MDLELFLNNEDFLLKSHLSASFSCFFSLNQKKFCEIFINLSIFLICNAFTFYSLFSIKPLSFKTINKLSDRHLSLSFRKKEKKTTN